MVDGRGGEYFFDLQALTLNLFIYKVSSRSEVLLQAHHFLLSSTMPEEASEELERFRQQWQKEVELRRKAGPSFVAEGSKSQPLSSPNAETINRHDAPPLAPSVQSQHYDDYDQRATSYGFKDPEDKEAPRRPGLLNDVHPEQPSEPTSALEHFERAIKREDEGSLGDSLSHYRKAYRLDAGVDRLYKNKYFPPSSVASRPPDPNPPNAPVTVPNTAHHSLDGPSTLPLSDLIASYQSSVISGQRAANDAPLPPCPIASLPSEILVKILLHTAILDPALFMRLSLVCKRFAYLVATEDRIWRELCLGGDYGFGSMHYTWVLMINGKPLPRAIADLDARMFEVAIDPSPRTIVLSPAYSSFKANFHRRPRIRFNGCYISTVNYIRPGAATASQVTWTSPVLIVTYYRYLRFFRDGSCASLLTTTEPTDVVHHLTKANLHKHHAGGLPSAIMNQALRGRWKLSGNPYDPGTPEEEEGTVHIETEGVDADKAQPKYIFKMMLKLKTAGKAPNATHNNKLIWLGYWNYNKLTDGEPFHAPFSCSSPFQHVSVFQVSPSDPQNA